MASSKLVGDQLIASLKQLILSFGPVIKDAGSQEQAEDVLLHLEESDENFHRYEFVKNLRGQLDLALGPLIDEELERHSIHPNEATTGQETLVNRITDRLKMSREYIDLTTNLKQNIQGACNYLVTHFDREFMAEQVDPRAHQRKGKPKPGDLIFSDAESSFDDSSLNQSSFMFMNNNKLNKLAENLEKKKPAEQRTKALHDLSHVAAMDFQNVDAWSLIRQGVQDALADKDPELNREAIKFVARGFSTNNPSTKEMYIALLEFMIMQFKSRESTVPKLKNGLDCSKPDTIKLIRCFTMMNEFQKLVTQYWIRFPEKFLEDVIEQTLSLLSHYQTSAVGSLSQITPIHFLALIDTKAIWISKWMHGFYSRAPLLKMLQKHRNIVDNAVRSCLDYATNRQVPFDTLSELSDAPSKFSFSQKGKLGSKRVYSGHELEFVYFVHSLKFLGHLLCYESGRSFFPARIRDRDEPVSVTTLVVTLVHLITEPVTAPYLRSPLGVYDPCQLVTGVLKQLCSNEGVALKTMCKDDVTNALLMPISHMIDGSQDYNTSEATLLQIADVLSMIASCSVGRKHLLYGETRDRLRKSRSSPAHMLAEFAKKSLRGEIPAGFSGTPSKAVIGNFVYVCRQLYNLCEGLVVMFQYDLHSAIATAWKVASRESDNASTPTPSLDGRETDRQSQYILLWEDTLRDNLLNFAGTPKGLLLLQQTGAINECVSYMYSRYARKVQVGKCEKFGYGYMMSQVAATSVGMVALQKTGFISTLIKSLWGALEVVDDTLVTTPRCWPTTVIDKTARKAFANLVNLLSSFVAVYEVLGNKPLPTKPEYSFREMPETIAGVLDRLVLLDTDPKIHALYNVEQSHIFGLRVLSIMICCLDTFLLLQTQYKVTEVMLRCQEQNQIENGAGVVLDMLSLERNYILVKCYSIGGPAERKIPPRCLPDDKAEKFKYPLFSCYPPPKEYMCTVPTPASLRQENDLSKYLAETKKSNLSKEWLGNLRKTFCSVLTTKPDQAKGNVMQDLLERCVAMASKDPQECPFPLIEYTGSDTSVQKFQLNDMQHLGIKMVVQYGTHLHLLSNERESIERLTALTKKVSYYLHQQQRGSSSTNLLCLKTGYCGFDWFTSTIFLLMNGNKDRTWKFLHQFSTLISSPYLWMQRLHSSQHLPQSLQQSGIPPIFSSTCHNIELVLQTEIPHVYSAFKVSGYAPAQICQHWIRQCFWNYLNWQEICHYICVCILLGVDYQVYMCVSILKHLQHKILQKTQDKDLLIFLKEEPLKDFKVGEHLEFMQNIESKFRRSVLPDMQNISKP